MNEPISLECLLERAIQIAEQQHAGQVDKAGRPYIEHPKRVMDADLRDNADLARIASPTAADVARTEKYQRAMAQLDGA